MLATIITVVDQAGFEMMLYLAAAPHFPSLHVSCANAGYLPLTRQDI